MSDRVFVISKSGKPLMPMPNKRGRIRHMLKDGRAKIVSYRPFTIQLLYDTTEYTQPVELCMDMGYLHIGVSVKSEKEEFVSEEYILLNDEKERHDARRKYRRTRRNKKRYRKPRWNNRKRTKPEGWIAPSLKNKADRHKDIIIKKYSAVCPIKYVITEAGEFDTQLLQAIEEGKAIPEGKDYQHGALYGLETLRSAVLQRDGHTCQICKKNGIKNNIKLHTHHVYYWRGQHGNRMDELLTVCDKCHTPANHAPGGKLYGLDPGKKRFTGAAYMNIVKWYIYSGLKEELPDVDIRLTYGAMTKVKRQEICHLEKSHANDAYAMGEFHPKKRAKTVTWQKVRRNNRILEKFYDAKYIDIRDGSKKSGKQLGSERTNRSIPRNNENSLRKFRGEKLKKCKRVIRKQRYPYNPGDVVIFNNERKCEVVGVHCNGTRVMILVNGNKKSVSINKVRLYRYVGGWKQIAA